MGSFISFIRHIWTVDHPLVVTKRSDALRLGLLGTSWIYITYPQTSLMILTNIYTDNELAIFPPVRSHPEVIVAAVAGREDLLDGPSIDAIYNPLPSGLHYEWSINTLKAGKHVLVEKPITSNAMEAKALFDFHASLPSAARPVLEAFHYRFHPAWTTFLSLISPKDIERVDTQFAMFSGFFSKNDIRFNYDLARGALMDIGTYSVSALRGFFNAEPMECIGAKATVLSGAGEDKR